MSASTGLVPLLVFLNVLSGTLLIPAARGFLATVHPGSEAGLHAFFSVNMLGAACGAPLLSRWADRSGRRRAIAAGLSGIDGVLLLGCSMPIPFSAVLGLRLLQGAAAVGALSLLMARTTVDRPATNGVHGASPGSVGAAIVAAIALGSPLGGVALRLGPTFPVQLSALLALFVAVATLCLREERPATNAKLTVPPRRAVMRAVALPVLVVACERFAVGCFVVTFSLHAHRAGASDGQVATMFTLFLLPFAVASWPFGRAATRFDRGSLVVAGMAVYGLSFLGLAVLPLSQSRGILVLAGLASAAIYGPVLCLAATKAPTRARATAMGLVNAAGTLGMLVGTAVAGILSMALQRRGIPAETAYRWVFALAGATQWLVIPFLLRGVTSGLRIAAPEARP